MRFETLTYDQKRQFLKRLHNRLNKLCFNGELNQINRIDIDNINKNGTDIAAVYRKSWEPNWEKQTYEWQKSILFSHEFINDVIKRNKQRDQIYDLARIMHHEMIHQYCDENGIPDKDDLDNDHNKAWAKAAEEHGLSVQYDEDGILCADGSLAALWISETMRIR